MSARCIRTLVALVVLSSIAGASKSHAQAQPAPAAAPACFEAKFDRSQGPIRRMLFSDGRLMLTQWGVPNAIYRDEYMTCTDGQNGALSCQVACDGGRVTIADRSDGGVDVQSTHLRLIAKFDSSLLVEDADGASLRGAFKLGRVPASVCEEAFARELDPDAGVALRAGDFSPRVKRLEQSLSSLGYFSQQPDWYFTGATAEALRAFQRFARIEPTGLADATTFRKLRLLAGVSGGC